MIKEFYGRKFLVAEEVFEPRRSTETLVSSVLENEKLNPKKRVLDLCTGSGVVAITIAKETGVTAEGIDISQDAVKTAKINSVNLNANADFYIMDVLKDWGNLKQSKYDVIVTNPPYWTLDKIIKNPNIVAGNPFEAFFGGKDGMKYHRYIATAAPWFLNSGGKIYMQMSPDQIEAVKILLGNNGFEKLHVFQDSRGKKQAVSAQLV